MTRVRSASPSEQHSASDSATPELRFCWNCDLSVVSEGTVARQGGTRKKETLVLQINPFRSETSKTATLANLSKGAGVPNRLLG